MSSIAALRNGCSESQPQATFPSYGDKVKFVFNQMPLAMHKQAFKAAQASVCAQEQGKFWSITFAHLLRTTYHLID